MIILLTHAIRPDTFFYPNGYQYNFPTNKQAITQQHMTRRKKRNSKKNQQHIKILGIAPINDTEILFLVSSYDYVFPHSEPIFSLLCMNAKCNPHYTSPVSLHFKSKLHLNTFRSSSVLQFEALKRNANAVQPYYAVKMTD
jgi:hypothetical protein